MESAAWNLVQFVFKMFKNSFVSDIKILMQETSAFNYMHRAQMSFRPARLVSQIWGEVLVRN